MTARESIADAAIAECGGNAHWACDVLAEALYQAQRRLQARDGVGYGRDGKPTARPPKRQPDAVVMERQPR